MPRNTPTSLQKATLPVGENEGELTTRIVRLDQRFVTKLGPSDERYRITDARSTGLSIRMEPSGNHTWQVRVPSQEGARQIWQTLGKVADIPVRRARRLASDTRKIAADDPNSRKALGKDRAQKLPFEELAEEWMDTYVAKKKPGTQTSYQEKLDLYILPRFRNHKLRQMDAAAIRAWHEDITAKGVCAVQKDSTRKPRQAARSADVALGTFASFFRFAIQEGWIVSNPTRDVPHNGDHKIHRPMDGNARRKAGQTIRDMMVDGSANPIHLMAVQVSMATSLRREALTSLEWREVDLERRFIRLETKNTTAFDPQYIPIGSAAYTILRGIPRIGDSPYVFPGRNPNRPMAPGTFNAVWNKIRERAGIYGDYPEQDRYGKTIEKPPIRPHDLRHTKAAKLAETNENAMVGALVGIKTTSMIDRYGGPGKKKKEEVNEGYETCLAEDKLSSRRGPPRNGPDTPCERNWAGARGDGEGLGETLQGPRIESQASGVLGQEARGQSVQSMINVNICRRIAGGL
ncbi:MAG: tyrosine-type recombinase/integrase [Holophaga sp.]|nr:tyrosine-type recombinase/integrase [Holophaga sp.]